MVNQEETREILGRVLQPLLVEHFKSDFIDDSGFIDALAEQAIVIEVKVHHYNPGTRITWDSRWKRFGWPISEIEDIGTPGKALAIIVPLEEET